jgi:Tol biopolymer transport system component
MARIRIFLFSILCLTLLAGAAPQKPTSIEALMGTALRQEEVEGNLEAAIATYMKVIAATGVPRTLAATAQYHIGLCYEKLGNTEARKAFERVLSAYQDQKDTIALARARMNAMDTAGLTAAPNKGISLRQIKLDRRQFGPPSPDGRNLAYSDPDGDLAVYSLDTGVSRKLTHHDSQVDEGAAPEMAWSPDGTKIAYGWYKDKKGGHSSEDLRVIGTDGSALRILFESPNFDIADLKWFPDGKSLAVASFDPARIVRVPVEKGAEQVITKLASGVDVYWLDISPDGKYIAYDTWNDIFVLPAAGGGAEIIGDHQGSSKLFGWDREGQSLLFISDRSGVLSLWRIAINGGKPTGEPELVQPTLTHTTLTWPIGSTRDGSYFFWFSGHQNDIYTATLDWAGGKVAVPPKRLNTTNIGSCSSPTWSPDGRYLAYLAAGKPSEQYAYSRLFIWSAADGSQREFVLNRPLNIEMEPISWTRDGHFLLARSDTRLADDKYRVELVRIDVNTGEVTVIAHNQKGGLPDYGNAGLFGWTDDAKTAFVFRKLPGSYQQRIALAIDLASGLETELYRSANGIHLSAALGYPVSPDGKWLAIAQTSYPQAGKSTSKLIAVPTAGGAIRELAAFDGSGPLFTEWSSDSKHVLYCLEGRSQRPTALWEVPIEGGAPRGLGLEMRGLGRNSLNPDGKHIAFMGGGSRPAELWVIENIPALKPAGK